MSIELLQPLLEDGIRNVNFFNGRLLSAEDMRAEQVASRLQHQLLGQAIGEGIARSGADPIVPELDVLLRVEHGRGSKGRMLAAPLHYADREPNR